jgi:hypothetical protein
VKSPLPGRTSPLQREVAIGGSGCSEALAVASGMPGGRAAVAALGALAALGAVAAWTALGGCQVGGEPGQPGI